MCGRYTVTTKAEALAERFHATLAPGVAFAPRYNAVPVQKLPVILNDHPEEITIATLGLVSEGGWDSGEQPYHIVGAKTVAVGQHFHQAFATRRCLELSRNFHFAIALTAPWLKGEVGGDRTPVRTDDGVALVGGTW